MNSTASLLLDVGGQGILALVLDEQARPCFKAHRRLDVHERGERVEQDPEQLADALQALVVEALSAVDSSGPAPPVPVALAVQRGSVVCWDRDTGAALSPVLSWRDRRSLARLAALGEQAESIRQRTGLRHSPYAGAPKLAWCLSELPPVRAAAEQGRLVCGPLGSFLLARLVRQHPARVDPTLAQRTLLWSHRARGWDPWLLERFGLSARLLPQIVPSHSHHGRLQVADTPAELMLLMGDQNCLPFLHGQPDPDTLTINLGTGAFLLRPVPEPVDDARFQLTLLDQADGGRWALEGSVHGAASALNWLAREHSVQAADHDWSSLDQRVDTPPLFLNRIDGLGSPWWQAASEAAFIDPDAANDHSPQALLLAVLESIAFLIRANVDAMSERLARPQRIVICGGLSQSDTLCGLIANLLSHDLERLSAVEGTALGLWCRLHRAGLPAGHFNTVSWRRQPALERRYQQWLAQINCSPP